VRRLLAAAVVLALSAGCGTAMTRDRLGSSFGEVFSGLYVTQQSRLGRTDVTLAGLRTTATCARNGPAKQGPGEDWICRVRYVDQDTPFTQAFEVQAKPDGCWRAEGPPTAQPPQLVDPADGSRSTNPLAEFDGCVDTSW
jgi:hypothetical protein